MLTGLPLLLITIIPVVRVPGVGGGGTLRSCVVLEEVSLARRQVSHWHPRSILRVLAVAGAFPLCLQPEHRGGQQGEKDPAKL